MQDRQKKGNMNRSCPALIQRSFSNAPVAAHTSWALFGIAVTFTAWRTWLAQNRIFLG